MILKLALLAFACIAFTSEAAAEGSQYASERATMIKTIQAYAQTDLGLSDKKGISESVLEAMRQTKRHLFVPERFRSFAYADRPVPIGHDQTISQPYIVALMTDLAEVRHGHSVLEIGTGSGYQAAILARLVKKVCTIEIIRPLGETATKLLENLGHQNVSVRIGDGYRGWPECGPFDAVIVTAALGHVPPPLIEQLKVGGRLVMPVGSAGSTQQLTIVEKIAPGKTKTHDVGLVRFVPFTRSPN